jgi:hypothetical protein
MSDDIPGPWRPLSGQSDPEALRPYPPARPAGQDDSSEEDPQAVPRWAWRRRRREEQIRQAAEQRRQRERQAAEERAQRQREQGSRAAALRHQLGYMTAEPQRQGEPDRQPGREADFEAGS